MKKLLALLLSLTMLFSVAALFAGCEEKSKKKNSSSQNDDEDEEEEEEEEEKDSDKDSVEDEKDSENSDKNDKTDENDKPNGDEKPNEDEKPGREETSNDLEKAKQAFWDYIDVAQYANASKLEKIAPMEFWEANSDDSLDELKQKLPHAVACYLKDMESQYGEDYQVEYSIKNHSNVDDELVSEYAKALELSAGIDASGVDKAITLTVAGSVVNSEGEEAMPDTEVVIVCYNGNWYPVTGDTYDYNGTVEYYYLFVADFVIYITEEYMES